MERKYVYIDRFSVYDLILSCLLGILIMFTAYLANKMELQERDIIKLRIEMSRMKQQYSSDHDTPPELEEPNTQEEQNKPTTTI